MRTAAPLIAGLVLALAAAPVAAQPEVDVELEPDEPTGDDDGLDLGITPEAIAPPDDAPPPDEPPPEPEVVRDPKLAKKLATGAAKFVKKGDRFARRKKDAEAAAEYERALAAYLKSFELYPDAKVLVAAADLHAKLGRWLEAGRLYDRALKEAEVPLDARSQERAGTGLEEAMMHFGLVKLIVSPEGATITVDGEVVGQAPLERSVWLMPGDHTLAISHDGFVAVETTLAVEAGSESERTFELEAVPVKVVAPSRPPPPPAPPPLPPPPSKLPLWVGVGATGAFTAGAVVTGVLALGKHGTFTDESASAEDRDAAQSSGKTMALVTDVLTAGAVVAAGFTVYYYLKVYSPKANEHERLERERGEYRDEYAERRRRTRPARPKLVVAPTVQANGAGLVLGGWF